MKKQSSALYAVCLAGVLSISELPLENRSDTWWDMFWHGWGVESARQIKEKV